MQNYNVGDRVCLFGSSDPDGSSDGRQLANRGVVRVLPRRIHCPSSRGDVVQGIICHPLSFFFWSLIATRLAVQVGLLSKDNTEQTPLAYKFYKSTKSSSEALAKGFKETFCCLVPTDFVGVW